MNEIQFKWPSSPTWISQNEIKNVETRIRSTLPTFLKDDNNISCYNNDWYAKKNGVLQDVLVETGIILGSGGQTKVAKLYSPIKGEYYAEKQLPKDTTQTSQFTYRQVGGLPGCVDYYLLTDEFVIEPLYNGSLDEYIKKNFNSLKTKISAFREICTGLQNIHNKFNNTTLNAHKYFFSGFHGDMKPQNIFVEKNSGNTSACDIGDYGFANALNILGGSPAYFSPEKARFDNPGWTKEALMQFNSDLGTHSDIWALGLIFWAILKNQLGIDPIIQKLSLAKNENERYAILKSLKQAEIDQAINNEITAINTSSLSKEEKAGMGRCWEIIRGMLQIEPRQRLSIEKVLKKLDRIERKAKEENELLQTTEKIKEYIEEVKTLKNSILEVKKEKCTLEELKNREIESIKKDKKEIETYKNIEINKLKEQSKLKTDGENEISRLQREINDFNVKAANEKESKRRGYRNIAIGTGIAATAALVAAVALIAIAALFPIPMVLIPVVTGAGIAATSSIALGIPAIIYSVRAVRTALR